MKSWSKSRSFSDAMRYAVRGLALASSREQNVRIQVTIGTLVVCILLFLRGSFRDIAIIVFCVVLIVTLEMVNTCLELLADALHPEYSTSIRDMKDIAAGAVLFTSVGVTVVGLIVFLGTIQRYFL
jgi:diacylglycerol kinase